MVQDQGEQQTEEVSEHEINIYRDTSISTELVTGTFNRKFKLRLTRGVGGDVGGLVGGGVTGGVGLPGGGMGEGVGGGVGSWRENDKVMMCIESIWIKNWTCNGIGDKRSSKGYY